MLFGKVSDKMYIFRFHFFKSKCGSNGHKVEIENTYYGENMFLKADRALRACDTYSNVGNLIDFNFLHVCVQNI